VSELLPPQASRVPTCHALQVPSQDVRGQNPVQADVLHSNHLQNHSFEGVSFLPLSTGHIRKILHFNYK